MDEPAHVHELIADAQRGGRRGLDAFNTLVLSYQSQVYNVAYRILGEEAGAADATQDTFISAFKHIRNFRNASVSGSFKSFLLRTVTNACFDTLRYDKRRPATSLDDLGEDAHDDGGEYNTNEFLPSNDENPADAIERADIRRHIEHAMRLLPADQRTAFVLSDLQHLSYDEIADVMQTSLGTVKSRLSRARAKLRDYLLSQPELLPEEYRLLGE
jgi:RNA polymerase sigma-70 factor (ECF subfamily)